MAKAMITLTWCDKHLTDKDEEVPAEQFEWNGRHVDLCGDCATPLLEVQAIFTEYGSTGKRTPTMQTRTVQKAVAGNRVSDPQGCPICGKTYKNRDTLGTHAREQHGKTLAEIDGKPLDHKCRWCDKAYATGQGLSLHERQRHPVEYQEVRKQPAAAK